jgi:hypothetical protein
MLQQLGKRKINSERQIWLTISELLCALMEPKPIRSTVHAPLLDTEKHTPWQPDVTVKPAVAGAVTTPPPRPRESFRDHGHGSLRAAAASFNAGGRSTNLNEQILNTKKAPVFLPAGAATKPKI